MKKIFVLALSAAIIACFAACSDEKATTGTPASGEKVAETSAAENDTVESTDIPKEEASEDDTADFAESSKEPTVIELSKEDKPLTEEVALNKDDVMKMMDGIMSYEPGTAGSSLKIYISAFGVLNLSERYDDSLKPMVEAAVAEHIAALPDERIAIVKDTVSEIEAIAANVFANGVDSMAEVLEDAGNPQLYDSYSKENYDKVIAIIENAVGN